MQFQYTPCHMQCGCHAAVSGFCALCKHLGERTSAITSRRTNDYSHRPHAQHTRPHPHHLLFRPPQLPRKRRRRRRRNRLQHIFDNNNLPTMYSVVLPFHCTSARCTLPLSSTKYIINLASGGPVRSTPVMSNRRARESAPSARFYCLGAD